MSTTTLLREQNDKNFMVYSMQRQDDDTEPSRSRPSSRRNSASSRRSSVQKEREVKKKSPLNSAPSSANSTPKKQVKQNLEFCVTGKQILRKSDRANSLPGGYQRRPSGDALRAQRRPTEAVVSPKPAPTQPANYESRDESLEDDMSLDLSQVSDFEDSNSKYGPQKFAAFATSTPKGLPRSIHKSRSGSLQSQLYQKVEHSRRSQKAESRQSISTFCSRDSLLYKSPSSAASNYRYGTELDYSSVSPEYSGQSSSDLSPRNLTRDADMALSPRSQELHVSSCCVSSWQDCSDTEQTKVEDYRRGDAGEWNNFWANYNNSIAKVPMKSYYDQCPTPYRTEDINLADLDFSTASSKKRSPDDMRNINNIIRNEGLHLTPRETQSIIKCAHILGNVLTKAIERRAKDKDVVPDEEKEETVIVQEVVATEEKTNENPGCTVLEPLPTEEMKNIKRKSLSLNLKETVMPLEVKEEKSHETVTTQTDISLPNTKSAPKIFEKILRQLSKTSLEESLEKLEKKALESKELEKKALENRELKKKELEFRDLKRDKCDTETENKEDEVDIK